MLVSSETTPDTACARGPFDRKQVCPPDEGGDEGGGGARVDVARGALLNQDAGIHHGDDVRHAECFRLVVRHIKRRHAGPQLHRPQLAPHMVAQARVEVGQGLIEQQQFGTRDQRARERQPLLLTAGQLRGDTAAVLVQPDHGERLLDPGGDLLA